MDSSQELRKQFATQKGEESKLRASQELDLFNLDATMMDTIPLPGNSRCNYETAQLSVVQTQPNMIMHAAPSYHIQYYYHSLSQFSNPTNLNPHSNHPNPSRPSGAGQDPPQSQEEAAEKGEGGIDVAGHILCQQER